jgi:hypothetical protein
MVHQIRVRGSDECCLLSDKNKILSLTSLYVAQSSCFFCPQSRTGLIRNLKSANDKCRTSTNDTEKKCSTRLLCSRTPPRHSQPSSSFKAVYFDVTQTFTERSERTCNLAVSAHARCPGGAMTGHQPWWPFLAPADLSRGVPASRGPIEGLDPFQRAN